MVQTTLLLLLLLAPVFSNAANVVIDADPPSHPWLSWANITVNWTTNGDTADEDAWIGAFLAPWPATYIKWQASSTPSGSVTFRLLNARHPYVFRYFQGNKMIAESAPIAPLGRAPHQGHLSLIPGHTDRMALVWVSNSSEPQTVKWGANRKTLDHATADGAVNTTTIVSEEYTSCMRVPPVAARTTSFANLSEHRLRCGQDHVHWSDSCYFDTTAPELHLDPGFIHTAVVTPLPPPGQPVYYSFGATAAFGGGGADDPADPTARSATYSFVSPRPPGDRTAFSFLYTADAGIGGVPPDEAGGATHNDAPVNGADSVFEAIAADAAAHTGHITDEFVILNGDISYARVS
jgi:hypothetical protein